MWLALHLPQLPLEASAHLPSPSAIIERGRVLCADNAARQAGIARGTGAAAARMLVPAIALIDRDRQREIAALHRLACWAGSLTPRISLTPDTLLLEIGGCLRLFGGLEKLVAAAQDGIQAQGFSARIAAAPTPLGAEWLARSATAALCRDAEALRRQLAALPIGLLPDQAAATLARFGLRTLADVRRLPSGDLARRIGSESLQALARAFGELPDPRVDFVFPERFALSLQLPAAVENAGTLLFAARRLTAALAGWLAVRQAGVREITLRLQQRQAESLLLLQFADPTADAGRFERVLRERLENTSLDAPVEALRLEATHVDALPGRNRPLFTDVNADHEAIGVLFERLCARLGEQQIYRLRVHDDHRPECVRPRQIQSASP
ncbi:MAG: DNA polymerase Y family protein, partial [Propionivibrio sp.]